MIVVLLMLGVLLSAGGCSGNAYEAAVNKLSNYSLEDVVEAFTAAGDYEDAPLIAAMYQKYLDKDYAAASNAFFDYYNAGNTTVSLSDWIYDLLYNRSCETDADLFSLIKDAYRPALKEHLGEDFTFAGHTSPVIFSPSVSNLTNNAIIGDSMDDMIVRCGTAPAGKVIICFRNETANSLYWGDSAMSLGLTAMLPEDLIPNALAEVVYIVFVTFTEFPAGEYSDGTDGYILHASVDAEQCPAGNAIYHCGSIEGGAPPSYATQTGSDTYGGDPDWEEVAALIDIAVDVISQPNSTLHVNGPLSDAQKQTAQAAGDCVPYCPLCHEYVNNFYELIGQAEINYYYCGNCRQWYIN